MLLTDEEIQARLDALQTIRITLEEDPVAKGLSSINQKLAQVQASKDRITSFLLEAVKNRSEAEILRSSVKYEYERKHGELLATDADVQSQKSESLRTAHANAKMPDILLSVHSSELEFAKADAYFKCVQQVANNLESENDNISRQISVLQLMEKIGEVNRGDLSELWKGKQIKLSTEKESK